MYLEDTRKRLFAGGDFPVRTEMVTIASTQGTDNILEKGSVLGIANDGKYYLSASAAVDGSETAEVVLMQDTDTTTEVEAQVLVSGDVLDGALVFGTGHTVDTVRADLRRNNIYIVEEV
jgi:hypothetical protein